MVRRALILAALLTAAIPVSAFGSDADCHELVMSYIYADQDKPKEPGDLLYEGQDENGVFPKLLSTTGYFYGSKGSHGDRMRKGYCAFTPQSYGSACIVYEAIPQEDGSYRMGEYLTTLEIRDTGYGYPTGEGKSKLRPDKGSMGTLETGQSIDVYYPTLSGCRDWMKQTGGYVFAVIIPAQG